MPLIDEPIDALAAGVIAVACTLDFTAAEIDAAFAAELRLRHGTPECDRPAPLHLAPYDI